MESLRENEVDDLSLTHLNGERWVDSSSALMALQGTWVKVRILTTSLVQLGVWFGVYWACSAHMRVRL